MAQMDRRRTDCLLIALLFISLEQTNSADQ
jgi:hypothetical protein